MKVKAWGMFGALVLTLMAGYSHAQATQPQIPNVVLILADNVGYGDLGPYGGGRCGIATYW